MRIYTLFALSLVASLSFAQEGPDLAIDSTYFVVPEYAIMNYYFAAPQYYLVRIHNRGDTTAYDFRVSCTVQSEFEQLFYSEQAIAMLAAGDSMDIRFNEEPFLYTDEVAWQIENGREAEILYEVEAITGEVDVSNNTQRASWLQSEEYIAKERSNTTSIPLSGEGRHIIGNCFYYSGEPIPFPLEYQNMAFSINNTQEWLSLSDRGEVTILLYESDGDQNDDGVLEPNEYGGLPILFNQYIFDGNETDEFIVVPIDIDEWAVDFQPGKYYILCLEFFLDEGEVVELAASAAIDYAATIDLSRQIGVPQYASAYSLNSMLVDSVGFQLNAFGTNIVPLIRLVDRLVMSNESVLPPEYQLTSGPSPADGFLNVKLDFPEPLAGELQIRDMLGVLRQQQIIQSTMEQETQLDVAGLPSGTYVLSFTVDGLVQRSSLFVVQH